MRCENYLKSEFQHPYKCLLKPSHVHCGDPNEKCFLLAHILNTWSSIGGAVWTGHGTCRRRCPLMGKVQHSGWVLRVCSLTPLQVLSASCGRVKCHHPVSSPAAMPAFPTVIDSPSRFLSQNKLLIQLFAFGHSIFVTTTEK